MAAEHDIETVILRFRDLGQVPGSTVERHAELAADGVWWGWWKKSGERVPLEAFGHLRRLARAGGITIMLLDTGQRQLHRATCVDIHFGDPEGTVPSPEPLRTPAYYRETPQAAWFRLTEIDAEPMDPAVLRDLTYVRVDDFFVSDSSDLEPFYGKVIDSIDELEAQERSIWFVRSERDEDHETGLTGAPGFSITNLVSRDTWTVEDKLGYGLYAQAIAQPILDGVTQPPLTVGIQAPWGHGKTSLMRMIQAEFDDDAPRRDLRRTPASVNQAVKTTYKEFRQWLRDRDELPAARAISGHALDRHPDDPETPRRPGMLITERVRIPTVWFNPLYYRETEQVWAGLAHAMLHQLVDQLPTQSHREKFWFLLQLRRVNVQAIRHDIQRFFLARFIPLLAGFLFLALAGISATVVTLSVEDRNVWDWLAVGFPAGLAGIGGALWAVFRWYANKTWNLGERFERYVTEPSYESQLGLLHLVDNDLDRAIDLLVGEYPIAVFIDDLDRCDPSTVADVILAINQFLSLPRRNVFFFVGMDMALVAAALERAGLGPRVSEVGHGSFGWRFMEKFVQLPFVIPEIDPVTAHAFAVDHLGGAQGDSGGGMTDAAEIDEATDVPAVARAAKDALEAARFPDEVHAIQAKASARAAELMAEATSDEIEAIVAAGLEDLDLNPRTMKRYFALVRVLRNVQVATGVASPDDADRDRVIVLRLAHLLLNWPEFVHWAKTAAKVPGADSELTSVVEVVHQLCQEAEDNHDLRGRLGELLTDDGLPPFLADPVLGRFLLRIAGDDRGLPAMYADRLL